MSDAMKHLSEAEMAPIKTYHHDGRNFGSGFDMVKRILLLEDAIATLARAYRRGDMEGCDHVEACIEVLDE